MALRSLVLGYDVDEAEARRQLRRLAAARAELPADDPRLLAGEAGILQIFADVSALWRNRRVPGESQGDDEAAVDDEAARNPQEYMHAYLRSRDVEAEGLPESFQIKLRRTLAHYGITDLDTSPDLDPALYRIFLAHRRAAVHVPVVADLLQWRLRDPDSLSSESLADDARDGYRRVVDQLVSATQLRHPAVGDLARQVRYRCFDAPPSPPSGPGPSSRCARNSTGCRRTPRPGRPRSTPSSPPASRSSACSPSSTTRSCSR